MKTVLIFAHECAPYNRTGSTIGGQRPAQFAKHLINFGWRAIVICCDKETRRKGTKADLEKQYKNIINTIKNLAPNQPLIIPIASLPHDGLVDFLWYRMVKEKEDGTFKGKNRLSNIIRKPISLLKLAYGDYSQSWIPAAKKVAEIIASEIEIKICIGEHGPDAGLFLANWFSKKHNVPWIADFRDPVLQPHEGIKKIIYGKIISKLLQNCTCTINVTDYWSELDKNYFQLPAYCVTNGFDADEFNFPKVESSPIFSISYFGSIYNYQNIDLIFKALEVLKKSLNKEDLVSFKFIYRGLAYEQIKNLSKLYNVEEITDSLNYISKEEAKRIMMTSNHLLLLSVDPSKPQTIYYKKGFYPGKAFEYIGAQKPILCIPGDKGILETLIKETRTGVTIDSALGIANYLYADYCNWKNKAISPYLPNNEVVNSYSRKEQSRKLSIILNNII